MTCRANRPRRSSQRAKSSCCHLRGSGTHRWRVRCSADSAERRTPGPPRPSWNPVGGVPKFPGVHPYCHDFSSCTLNKKNRTCGAALTVTRFLAVRLTNYICILLPDLCFPEACASVLTWICRAKPRFPEGKPDSTTHTNTFISPRDSRLHFVQACSHRQGITNFYSIPLDRPAITLSFEEPHTGISSRPTTLLHSTVPFVTNWYTIPVIPAKTGMTNKVERVGNDA